ncbi:MAG: copper amine oxidase N-terminal domain-containing protein [Defluviitaleaceae bacterium]|nr:copper amine oxidase N-terminal domain-containing protein [Defluviitaleaceae bacterium]
MLDKIKGLKEKLPKLPQITIPEKFAKYTKYIKYGCIGIICAVVIGVGAIVVIGIISGDDAVAYENVEIIPIADRLLSAPFLDIDTLYGDFFVEEELPKPEPEPVPPPPLQIALNGMPILSNNTPAVFSSEVYVPLRGFFEELGYRVSRDSATGVAMVSDGVNTYIFSEEEILLTWDGAVMLSLTDALERMGYEFYFDEETNVFDVIYTYSEDNEYICCDCHEECDECDDDCE